MKSKFLEMIRKLWPPDFPIALAADFPFELPPTWPSHSKNPTKTKKTPVPQNHTTKIPNNKAAQQQHKTKKECFLLGNQ